MKIIINTTTLVRGGALQVAVSFLEELKAFGQDQYFVLLSRQVAAQIDRESFPPRFVFYEFDSSPASFARRRTLVKKFVALERALAPDVVFTVFGPSYWRPAATHVMGFAVVWAINPESVAFSRLKLSDRIKQRLSICYKRYYVRRDADHYIVETDDVKARMSRFIRINAAKIDVVGNTCNGFFDAPPAPLDIPSLRNVFRLVTIAANYSHKNLGIIAEVIPVLRRRGFACQFLVTIAEEEYAALFGELGDWVVNLGPVEARLCPAVYERCDALFLPTLLECFTASYPEAMKMGKPILTSDLGFARCLCGDAARYFDPLNPEDIAARIIEVASDPGLREKLVQAGGEKLKSFPTPKERAVRYTEICTAIAGARRAR